jgi:uncharacterized membrane protein
MNKTTMRVAAHIAADVPAPNGNKRRLRGGFRAASRKLRPKISLSASLIAPKAVALLSIPGLDKAGPVDGDG